MSYPRRRGCRSDSVREEETGDAADTPQEGENGAKTWIPPGTFPEFPADTDMAAKEKLDKERIERTQIGLVRKKDGGCPEWNTDQYSERAPRRASWRDGKEAVLYDRPGRLGADTLLATTTDTSAAAESATRIGPIRRIHDWRAHAPTAAPAKISSARST